MALNRSEIFLAFTTVVLAVFSIGLGKCYLSEKNEKLRQLNLNVQLNREKDDLQNQYNDMRDAKNDAETENQRLQERNVELGGNDLVRLQEINDRIEVLQNQVREQLDRDPEAEIPDDPRAEGWAMDRRRQVAVEERDRVVREINTEITNLHNEFLRIRLPQIRAEVQVAAYNRHNEIMQTYLNEIITAEGNLNRGARIDVRRLRENVEQHNDDMQDALDDINNRINQELENREVHE